MRVTVAFALPAEQVVVPLEVEQGTTVVEAIRASGLPERFPEIDPSSRNVGIFGRVVSPERVLVEGDRVEIYRPLAMDPREARRRLAAAGQSMGRQGSSGREE